MIDEGGAYATRRYREIVHERYLISKHINTSYEDTRLITPLERDFILQFITEDLERKQQIYEKAQADAEMRRNERRSSRRYGRPNQR